MLQEKIRHHEFVIVASRCTCTLGRKSEL